MDLAAKGWISTPRAPPCPPRPRAVPRFPHLPGEGTFLTCLMHFEPPPLGRAGATPRPGSPAQPGIPQPVCSTHLGTDWFGFGAVSHSLEFLGVWGWCFCFCFGLGFDFFFFLFFLVGCFRSEIKLEFLKRSGLQRLRDAGVEGDGVEPWEHLWVLLSPPGTGGGHCSGGL